jgi:uncharacterized membrane protein
MSSNDMNSNLKKLVLTALFTALTCVATMSIRIPTPGTSGYIHLGDALVILSGVILGPAYGLVAGGLGSAMADLLGGYFLYVPITFLIKGMISLLSGLIYKHLGRTAKTRSLAVVFGGIVDIVFVTLGYFIFDYLMYGISAAVSIPASLVQGIGGMVISILLYPLLHRLVSLEIEGRTASSLH